MWNTHKKSLISWMLQDMFFLPFSLPSLSKCITDTATSVSILFRKGEMDKKNHFLWRDLTFSPVCPSCRVVLCWGLLSLRKLKTGDSVPIHRDLRLEWGECVCVRESVCFMWWVIFVNKSIYSAVWLTAFNFMCPWPYMLIVCACVWCGVDSGNPNQLLYCS